MHPTWSDLRHVAQPRGMALQAHCFSPRGATLVNTNKQAYVFTPALLTDSKDWTGFIVARL